MSAVLMVTNTNNKTGDVSKRRFLMQERDLEGLQAGLRTAEAEVSQLARLPVSQNAPQADRSLVCVRWVAAADL
jgi:hypothetical protein